MPKKEIDIRLQIEVYQVLKMLRDPGLADKSIMDKIAKQMKKIPPSNDPERQIEFLSKRILPILAKTPDEKISVVIGEIYHLREINFNAKGAKLEQRDSFTAAPGEELPPDERIAAGAAKPQRHNVEYGTLLPDGDKPYNQKGLHLEDPENSSDDTAEQAMDLDPTEQSEYGVLPAGWQDIPIPNYNSTALPLDKIQQDAAKGLQGEMAELDALVVKLTEGVILTGGANVTFDIEKELGISFNPGAEDELDRTLHEASKKFSTTAQLYGQLLTKDIIDKINNDAPTSKEPQLYGTIPGLSDTHTFLTDLQHTMSTYENLLKTSSHEPMLTHKIMEHLFFDHDSKDTTDVSPDIKNSNAEVVLTNIQTLAKEYLKNDKSDDQSNHMNVLCNILIKNPVSRTDLNNFAEKVLKPENDKVEEKLKIAADESHSTLRRRS